MIAVPSTFSNNSLSELHMKYFSRTSFRLQHSSRICLTVREHLHSSQSGWLSPESRYLWVTRVWPMRSLLRIAVSRREMSDAAVTKVGFDRVQFISRTSIPFSLPHFTIVHSELWNEIRGWALHRWDCWAESCFCSLIGTFITSDTSMTTLRMIRKTLSNWLWTTCLATTPCHFWALTAEITARCLSAKLCQVVVSKSHGFYSLYSSFTVWLSWMFITTEPG